MPVRDVACVLVPVLGGDISAAAFMKAREALARPDARRDARLVILHVAPSGEHVGRPMHAGCPRWRRLADLATPHPVFVDAVAGDPETVIRTQADRFGGAVVIRDEPPTRSRGERSLPRLRAVRQEIECPPR